MGDKLERRIENGSATENIAVYRRTVRPIVAYIPRTSLLAGLPLHTSDDQHGCHCHLCPDYPS